MKKYSAWRAADSQFAVFMLFLWMILPFKHIYIWKHTAYGKNDI